MIKKALLSIFILSFLVLPIKGVLADETPGVPIHFFWGDGCPHCEKEKVFLDSILDKYEGLRIKSYEVYNNQENYEILKKVSDAIGVTSGGVPFLIIGNGYLVGFSEKMTPPQIEKKIVECLKNSCPDIVGQILNTEVNENTPITSSEENNDEDVTEEVIDPSPVSTEESENNFLSKIDLPIIGEVDVKSFSLPVLTVIMAFLDGFNPCAMWVLLFLVSLLFGIENKKRLWVFGFVFLIASGFVYFLFMTAWLNLFMFLGFIVWIRILIGGVALVSGYVNIKEYITNPFGGCKVTGGERKQKLLEWLKSIIQEKHIFIAIIGLILLAFAVNLIELVCSLGLPAVYVQVLALSDLSTFQYYLYLLFYVLVFILPATFVFSASAITLQVTGISTRYNRMIHLVSGIIMLIIGLLMIFKPEWLMFG
ncbi:MAG: hypothetical protein WCX79_02295 [Candidatus Paceibacterota bacterium]